MATSDTPGGAPAVEVKQLPSTDFAPEPSCEALVEKHKQVLKALDVAKLCILPESTKLNSKVGWEVVQVEIARLTHELERRLVSNS